MKITIFIIVLVLKSHKTWKFDISDYYSSFEVNTVGTFVYLTSKLTRD